MDESYQVVVSNRAAKMLATHAGFLAQSSMQAARTFKSSFERAAASLARLPARNPTLKSDVLPKGRYYKLLFAKRYLLVYQIKREHVLIEAVIDCRQDYQWLI